jgi:ABC-type multidrug transport system fused ATPase/permease subunit
VEKKIKQKALFTCTSALMVICAAIDVLFAIVLQHLIDSVSTRNQAEFIKFIMFGLATIVFELLFSILSRYCSLKYVRNNLEASKDHFYLHLINREDNNKLEESKSELSMFSTNIDILSNNYYMNRIMMVNYIAKFIFAVSAVIFYNWIVFFVAFFTSLIPLLIPRIFKKKVRKLVDCYTSESKSYLDYVSDTLLGIDEIKAYNNQKAFFKKHHESNSDVEHARFNSKMMNYVVGMLSMNFSSLTFLVTIAICGYFVINGNLTIGIMMAIIQLLNSMVMPLVNISTSSNEMSSAKNVVGQYNVEVSNSNNDKPDISDFKSNILINQLSYSYDGKTPIINNFNCEFKKNKKYAVVGQSGSGKSTLAKLISGKIKGYSGKILIDGKDLSGLNIKSYRNLCRYINQQPHVFKDTIENNILFYKNEGKSLDNVIKMFNLESLVEKVGLKKRISDTDGISGGQKQRIILSRALLGESPILILDEPTANLDFDNTTSVIKELVKMKDLTLIMITHEHNQKLLNLFDEVITIGA